MAWVAGFYSGEGSCSLTKPRRDTTRQYAQMAIGNTDLENLHRCQQVIGGKVFGPYIARGPLSRKPYYALKLGAQEEVREALRILWPYLSGEKKKQAGDVLTYIDALQPIDRSAAWATRRARYGESGGNRGLTEEELLKQPCRNGHDPSEFYIYENPKRGGRKERRCRACARDARAAKKGTS